MSRHRVVAVAYDGLCTFEFGCTVELFALSRPELGVDWYDFSVCAAEHPKLTAMGGITVSVPHSLAKLDRADTIIVPGWRDAREPPPAALISRIRKAHERGARICCICSGVFVLAAAGILDGRRATTHWRYTDLLASRFPRIQVEPDALYVDEGSILTSAGSAAGLDMLIHLVRKDFGARVANLVARRLVIPPHRQGGQAQYIARPVAPDGRGRISSLLDWLRCRLHQSTSLDAMARRAAVSPRTLQREFRAATGESPVEWLLRERVAAACELLEQSAMPLAGIARRTGFGSLESLRRHFRRRVGVSPASYRSRFSRI